MLPGEDGFQILAKLRRETEAYVLMLTARSEEPDRVVGLTLGADDYLTKPFSPRELVARVKAILRRGRGPGRNTSLAFRYIRIDPARHEVWRDGERVDLAPRYALQDIQVLVVVGEDRELSRQLRSSSGEPSAPTVRTAVGRAVAGTTPGSRRAGRTRSATSSGASTPWPPNWRTWSPPDAGARLLPVLPRGPVSLAGGRRKRYRSHHRAHSGRGAGRAPLDGECRHRQGERVPLHAAGVAVTSCRATAMQGLPARLFLVRAMVGCY
jgi:hypothetical protein